MKHQLKLFSSWFTLLFFSVSTCAWAETPISIAVSADRETPSFLRIEVPKHLARVEEVYEAPPRVDPSLIVHVQNAHGNYDAQVKIRRILNYLYSTYGFNLVASPQSPYGPFRSENVDGSTIMIFDYPALITAYNGWTITGSAASISGAPLNLDRSQNHIHLGKKINVLRVDGSAETVSPLTIPLQHWTPQSD